MIDQVIGSVVAAGIDAAVRGGPRRQYKWNKRAAQDANQMNRENQQWLLDQERLIQEEQRKYDSPEAQMARYLAAGLNPHMIYGSGSSGGQAFPINAGNLPAVDIQAPSAAYPNPVPTFLGAMQTQAQLGLMEAKTGESLQKQALMDMQKQVLATNPMLNPKVLEAITNSTMAVADAKASEARYLWKTRQEVTWDGMNAVIEFDSYGAKKIRADVDGMMQRLGLNTVDLAIRNQILSSKQFENELKKIQVDWLQDGEITPQHVYQGLMLFFSKMMMLSK